MLTLLSDWLYHPIHKGSACISTTPVLIAKSSDGKHSCNYCFSFKAMFTLKHQLVLEGTLQGKVCKSQRVQCNHVLSVKLTSRGLPAGHLIENNIFILLLWWKEMQGHVSAGMYISAQLFSYDPKGCVNLNTSVHFVRKAHFTTGVVDLC